MKPFEEFLLERLDAGGFTTEDALGSFLPLLRQVVGDHQAGSVAPLIGLGDLHVEGIAIWYEEAKSRSPTPGSSELRRLERSGPRAVEIVSEVRRQEPDPNGQDRFADLRIGKRGERMEHPVYLPGYVTWEHELGHHDPITDVLSLGLILASLTCGLDLNDPEQLETFVRHRRNLFGIQPRIHPVVAKAVLRMTELERSARPQDLTNVLHTLENYRDQEVDLETDLARIEGFRERDLYGKREVLLGTLQKRLFEISRRNRLLHFRQTGQTVNLTHASVPLSFDPKAIRPEHILTWNDAFQKELLSRSRLSLNRHLRFNEALYLPGILDRIRSEARRDRAEFGFAQLRLVACFLHWSDLKETPPERYVSPLVLIPVELEKKKGIRDTYQLRLLDTDAEVNPVLRYQLKQLYDIELPEALDLTSTSPADLYTYLASRIQASESAVTLERIDRPRIDLLHDQARRRLDQYRRRMRLSGRGIRSFLDVDYSYTPENYAPLGLQLFQTRIQTGGTRLRTIVEERPRPRTSAAPRGQPEPVKERLLYALREAEEENPYLWEFDLCSVTLGNFRYRKMSLVRDYDALLEAELPNPAFDAVFSLTPRPVGEESVELPGIEERYAVVPCDPTQATSIAKAREGESTIIQGPPGTGKSQTISNLIADYVARGKRVLFVCEKRAAIDVVYHRLRGQGLEDLCCLIHDSQDDKKPFVLDLKDCYERLLEGTGGKFDRIEARRRMLVKKLERELEPLQRFDEAVKGVPEGLSGTLLELLERLVELRQDLPSLEPLEAERLPSYGEWQKNRDRLERLVELIMELQDDGVLVHHPLGLLHERVVEEDRPVEFTLRHVEESLALLDRVVEAVSGTNWPPGAAATTLPEAAQLIDHAVGVRPLVEAGVLSILDPGSPAGEEFRETVRRQERLAGALERAREGAAHWKRRLSREDTRTALEEARRLENSFFSFLSPAWWRLRRVLRERYDFRAATVRPRWTRVLEALDDEYEAAALFEEGEADARARYAFSGNTGGFADTVRGIRERVAAMEGPLVEFHRQLLASDGTDAVRGLAEARQPLSLLREHLARILVNAEDRTLEELRQLLERVNDSLDVLPDFLPCLEELRGLPPELRRAFREFALGAPGLEAASADRALEGLYRHDRGLARFDGNSRARHLRRIEKLHRELLEVNAGFVLERTRERFLENVRLSSLSASQLKPEEQEFKKLYSRGRRELEHEFSKTMRYKPIRTLAAGETGSVIRDLKPVWLMSPLSVSDTLPLDTKYFDVVIFDEASQITLEEAVPAIFRAEQAIVVGDRMQLPPTNFFSARRTEEEALSFEEGDETVEYDLDSNSFLTHSARNLPSTMLGWHYRSRFESLISFSNAAFYQGRLLTVPERVLSREDAREILVRDPEDGRANVDELLARPLSFHFIEDGVYSGRRNEKEARYIAHLVHALLMGKNGLSIGIVAFSEAQQSEIETALERLAREDRKFGALLEEEQERERDEQFVGLLVKNLENIQGDERDVVILSICYGPDPQGRMRMNFGPINQSGGEKRLNVAFSRARQHMVLVSSIRHGAITNDYNDGANCLKSYLRYAEATSTGDQQATRAVLSELSLRRDGGEEDGVVSDPAVEQIAAELRRRGYLVDADVGHSRFRCDLAVRCEGDPEYRLGILVDTRRHYAEDDVLARDIQRPALLRSFGWQVSQVLTRDWYHGPERVIERLEALLGGRREPEDDPEPGPADAAPVEPEPEAGPGPAAEPAPEPQPEPQPRDGDPEWLYDLKFVEGRSRKFWRIAVTGSVQTIHFGRIGTRGQTRTKEFDSAGKAARDAERVARQKMAKGYEKA